MPEPAAAGDTMTAVKKVVECASKVVEKHLEVVENTSEVVENGSEVVEKLSLVVDKIWESDGVPLPQSELERQPEQAQLEANRQLKSICSVFRVPLHPQPFRVFIDNLLGLPNADSCLA